MHTPAKNRPTYTLVVRAEPGIDPIRALRLALKSLLRRFGLRALSFEENNNAQ
jgi:hypothetical protein